MTTVEVSCPRLGLTRTRPMLKIRGRCIFVIIKPTGTAIRKKCQLSPTLEYRRKSGLYTVAGNKRAFVKLLARANKPPLSWKSLLLKQSILICLIIYILCYKIQQN